MVERSESPVWAGNESCGFDSHAPPEPTAFLVWSRVTRVDIVFERNGEALRGTLRERRKRTEERQIVLDDEDIRAAVAFTKSPVKRAVIVVGGEELDQMALVEAVLAGLASDLFLTPELEPIRRLSYGEAKFFT